MRNPDYSSYIRRYGQDFSSLTTGASIRGFIPPEGPAQFPLNSDIAPGHLLKDQNGINYMVADTAKAPGYLAAYLYQYLFTASITRRDTSHRDAFGYSSGQSTIIESVPVIVSHNQKRALVPVTAPVRPGDLLAVSDSTYAVLDVASGDFPGFKLLSIAIQGASGMVAKMQ